MIRYLALLPMMASASPLLHDGSTPRAKTIEGDFSSGKVALAIPSPNFTQAYFSEDPERTPLQLSFNKDASEITLEIPEAFRNRKDAVTLEIAEKSVAFPDGQIIFSALDSRVEGAGKAKLETHPGNHRVGFWSDLNDAVVWDYKPTTWGRYWVEVTYSLAGKGSEIEVKLGDQAVTGSIESTGTWYRYTTKNLGRIYLADDRKPVTLSVKGTKKLGGAVMNLKAVTLRPAPEGKVLGAIGADAEGAIILAANEATVYGQKLRYEPQPKKLCIGYWTVPTDYVTWDFKSAGEKTYAVTIFQGCSDSNAGSTVNVVIGDQRMTFKVKPTGHFQKFEPVEVGEITLSSGTHRLEVRPQRMTSSAVMDIQKIVLTPR